MDVDESGWIWVDLGGSGWIWVDLEGVAEGQSHVRHWLAQAHKHALRIGGFAPFHTVSEGPVSRSYRVTMLAPGTRFAHTKTWTIDCNVNGEHYYDVYHVVSATPKSLLLLRATLTHGDVHVQGNELMDQVVQAQTSDKDNGTTFSNRPRRYMLNKDVKGQVYFTIEKGTAMHSVYLKGGFHPVQFLNTSPSTVKAALKKASPKKTSPTTVKAALKKRRGHLEVMNSLLSC